MSEGMGRREDGKKNRAETLGRARCSCCGYRFRSR
jgi:hypothetical protein